MYKYLCISEYLRISVNIYDYFMNISVSPETCSHSQVYRGLYSYGHGQVYRLSGTAVVTYELF